MFTARQKIRFLLLVALLITGSAYFTVSKKETPVAKKLTPTKGQVAGIIDGVEDPNSLFIRIPTNIASKLEAAQAAIAGALDVFGTATFNGDVVMNGRLQLPDDVEAQGITLNLGEGTILASNLVYGVTAGDGITVTGGQNPVITNGGVRSLQGRTGVLSLEAGNGISLDGLRISSTLTQPSIPNFFKFFASPSQSTLSPSSTEDTITFVPGTGMQITTDPSTKQITFNSTAVSDPESIKGFIGFQKNGAVVSLYDSADNVGLGTSSPTQKLDVVGGIRLGSVGANNVLNTSAAGGAPTGSLYWGSREICDDSGNCGLGGSSAWSALTDPTANLDLAMAGYTTTFAYGNSTSTANLFNIIDSTSNTGTGYLFNIGTAGGSAVNPIKISAQSNNVFVIDSTGLVSVGSSISNGKAFQVTSDIGASPTNDTVNFALNNPTVNGHTVRLGFFEGTQYKASIEAARETLDNTGYLAFKTRSGAIAEAMRIKADGNVGIGTTNPGAKFSIGNNLFSVNSSGDISKIKNLSYSWPTGHGLAGAVLTNDAAGNLIWSDTSSSAGPWAASGNDVFPDSTSYNVGIGTTTTNAKLNVVGTSWFEGLATFQSSWRVRGGVNDMTMTAVANEAGGTFSTPGGMYFTPTYDFAVGTSNFIVKNNGNVGIGIQNPTSKFNVKGGDIRMTNAADANYIGFSLPAGLSVSKTYVLPLLDGNDGDALVTDGNGNLSWEAVAGGGSGSTILSDISEAETTNTIHNASYAQTWNWQLSGAGTKGFTIGETAASSTTGEAALLYVNALANSTAVPLHVANFGNGYSFRVDDQGNDSTPFVIDASGNVGVGTTTTNAKLNVDNNAVGGYLSARFSNDVLVGSSATNGNGIFFGSGGYNTSTGDYIRQTAVGTIGIFGGGTNASTAQLYVASGNVGVGTSSPANKFAIGSSSQFQVSNTGDISKIKNLDYSWPTAHGFGNYVLTNDGSGNLNWSAVSQGSTTWSDIAAPTNNLALGMSSYTTTFSYGSATSTNNLFTISDANANTGTGYLFSLANGTGSSVKPFRVTANGGGTEALMVSSNGNVGIGTTTPGSKLDVKGTFQLSGSSTGFVGFTAAASAGNTTYTWPSSPGTNGQVLTTNGASGGLSWTSIAQSGGSAWGYTNNVVHLMTAGDAVHVGGTGRVGKLGITGDVTSEPTFYVKGPASISSDYIRVLNSADQTQFSVTSAGNVNLRGANNPGITLDGGWKVLDFTRNSNSYNYFRMTGDQFNAPSISVQTQSTATDLDFVVTPLGTGNFKVTSGNIQFGNATPFIKHSNNANAVSFTTAGTGSNYINLYSNQYGAPEFQVVGALTDIDVRLVPKGAGNVVIPTGNLTLSAATPAIYLGGGQPGLYFSRGGNGSNYIGVYSNQFGSPEVQALGGATDLDLRLVPKGAGNVVIPNGNLTLSANTPSIILGGGQAGLSFSRNGNGAYGFNIYANQFGAPEFQVVGNTTNLDMRLVPKGTGNLVLPNGNFNVSAGGVVVSGTGNSSIAGNLGMGVTSPTEKLVVNGNIALNTGGNVIKFPTGNGDKILLENIATSSKIDITTGNNFGMYAGSTASANAGIFSWWSVTSNAFTEKMRMTNAGNLGVGTNSPSAMFDVAGTARVRATGSSALTFSGNNAGISFSSTTGNKQLTTGGSTDFEILPGGNVSIGAGTAATTKLKVNGDLEITGNCAGCSSDIRLKENITGLGSTLSRLLAIRGVSYTWADPVKQADFPGTHIGVIAQEVEAVFPEIVGTDARGYKFVRYDKLIAPTIEALREQQDQIAALQTGNTPEINTNNFVLRTFIDQFITFAENSLTFVKTVTFQAQARFENVSTFIGQAIFKNKAIFEKEVVFASQMGGRAVIKTGDTQVSVAFDQPFSEIPVITATAGDFFTGQHRIINKTASGFTIELSQVQDHDVSFEWQALRVDTIHTSQSHGGSAPQPTSTPTPSVAPEPSVIPTPSPSVEPTPSPTVEPTPEASPSASP